MHRINAFYRFLLGGVIGIISLFVNDLQASENAPKFESNGDTVIIKFGENSQLTLYIDNAEDRQTLGELDLNALVEKVNAYMNTQYSEEPVYSEANPKMVEKVEMEAEIKAVQIENRTNIPDENLPKEFGFRDTCQNENIKWVWNLDIGFNNYRQSGTEAGATTQDLKAGRSNYFAVGTGLKMKIAERTSLKVGAEISWNSLHFANSTRLENSEKGTNFVIDTFAVDKSKLNITYLSIPLMFQFESQKRWTFGVGGHLGYRVGTHFKREYRRDGVNKTEKEYDSFGVNNFKYGLRSEVGYEGWRLFMNYDLNALFKGNSPDLQLLSFGFRM